MSTSSLALRFSSSIVMAAILSVGTRAEAQGFNIDFDRAFSTVPATPSTYAAAGSAGVWNSLDMAATPPQGWALVKKGGGLSSAVIHPSAGFTATFTSDNPLINGDDASLMEDLAYGGGAENLTFFGLRAGLYDVYTYAMAPDNATYITEIDIPLSLDPAQQVGGAWTGSHVQGISYALHRVEVRSDGILRIYVNAISGPESLNGIQFEPLIAGDTGSGYCYGDGTGAICPCNATGLSGEGCANTSGTGASLIGSGVSAFSYDSFKLSIAGVPGIKPGLLLRANNQIASPVGDGILCTSGASARSQVQLTFAGIDVFYDFHGSPFSSVANVGIPTNFQYWYRDSQNPCSGSGFNFTNGWTVVFTP